MIHKKVIYLFKLGLMPLVGLAHSSEFHLSLVPTRQTLEIASQCEIKIKGGKRIINSNGIPTTKLDDSRIEVILTASARKNTTTRSHSNPKLLERLLY